MEKEQELRFNALSIAQHLQESFQFDSNEFLQFADEIHKWLKTGELPKEEE